jgi:sphingomyelin phosphodiesterase acid-like 3
MGDGAAANTFMLFSDVHFNPFADPSLVPALAASEVSSWKAILSSSKMTGFPAYGSDSNYALFESALADMAGRAGNVGTIIYPGDILGHNFTQLYPSLTGDKSRAGLDSFIQKTVAFFVQEVHARFPKATVIVADGNLDSAVDSIGSRPGDPYLALAAPVIAPSFFSNDADRTAFSSGFASGGYYAVQPDGPTGVKYIALNDNLWGNRTEDREAGMRELSWFASELADSAAKSQKVWVVAHIPVGTDASTVVGAYNQTGQVSYAPYLDTGFNDAFISLELAYSQTIAANFVGHTHDDDFKILSAFDGSGAAELMRIAPSISPVFGNNPGYQIYTYDPKTFSLLNETTYAINLGSSQPAWSKEYDYAQTYGQSLATPKEWWDAYNTILTNPFVQAAYFRFNTQGAPNPNNLTASDASVALLANAYTTATSFGVAAAALAAR